MTVQASWHLKHERLAWYGQEGEGGGQRSKRQNGEKKMLPVTEHSVPRGTCNVPSRKPLQKYFSQECRPKLRSDNARTLCANSHHSWARAIAVTGAERHLKHVQDGKTLYTWDPPHLLIFELATPNPANKYSWREALLRCIKIWAGLQIARAGHVHSMWTSFYSVKAAYQANGRTRLKPHWSIAIVSGHVP